MALHRVSSKINLDGIGLQGSGSSLGLGLGRENTVDDLRLLFGAREGKQLTTQPGQSAMTRSLSRNLSVLSLSSSRSGSRGKPKVKKEDSINLESLKEIKKMFDSATGEDEDGLDQDKFVENFRDILGSNMTDRELTFLFMKIDANSDGTVDWDEFSNFMLLENEGAAALGDGKAFRKFAEQDIGGNQPTTFHHHRELISRICCAPKLNGYITASRDGTFKVWSNRLGFIKEVRMQDRGRPSVRQQRLGDRETPLPELRAVRKDANVTGIPHSARKTTPAWITDMAYLPFCNRLCVATMDRLITFYDTTTWEPTFFVRKLPCAPLALHFYGNAESNMLVVGDDGGGIQYFKNWNEYYGMRDMANEEQRHYVDGSDYPRYKLHDDWITKVMFIPDMNSILTSSLDSVITVFDLGKKDIERTLEGHSKGVYSFAYCVECKVLATCGLERAIQLWNPYIAKPMSTLQGHTASVTDIVATCEHSRTRSEGHYFISLAADKVIKIWDAQTYRCLQTIQDKIKRMPEDRLSALAYDEARMSIITGAGTLQVWPRDGMQHSTLTADNAEELRAAYHHHQLCSALYNKNFDQVVSADHGSSVCVWKLETGQLAFRFTRAHGDNIITSIGFDQGGRRLITGAGDGSLKVWNFNNGACIKDLLPWDPTSQDDDGEILENYGTGRKRFIIPEDTDPFDEAPVSRRPWRESPWAILGKKHRSAAEENNSEVTQVLYVHDGRDPDDDTGDATRVFVSVGWDRKISVWQDTDSPEEPCDRQFFGEHNADITSAAFCPPHTIATVSADGVIKIWNAESGRLSYSASVPDTVPKGSRSLEKVLFHTPYPNLAATCGGDGYLRYWLLSDTKIVHLSAMKLGHTFGEQVQAMVISEEGDYVATADTAGCIKVWNSSRVNPKLKLVSTALVPLAHWRAHMQAIVSVDWISKHEMVLSASVDRTVMLWTSNGQCVGTFGQSPPWHLEKPNTWDPNFEPLPMPAPKKFVGRISDNVPSYLKALRDVNTTPETDNSKSSASTGDHGDEADDDKPPPSLSHTRGDSSSDILPSLALLKARRMVLDPGYHGSIRSNHAVSQLNFHMLRTPSWSRLPKPEIRTPSMIRAEQARAAGHKPGWSDVLNPLAGGRDGAAIVTPRDFASVRALRRKSSIRSPVRRPKVAVLSPLTPSAQSPTTPASSLGSPRLSHGPSPRTRRVRAISNSRSPRS
eukprot:TRINITY_DN23550_c0_g1_i1.p1 TRINITY_DN23550_c0_g1~~TRINITY_DN23550_c0_g1_i1.p1  ORF type:complete len:1206 (+),score=227.35 TRINITY_DN23550_c0_g1_i1:301-3918(+)